MDIAQADLAVLRTIVQLDTEDEGRSIGTRDIQGQLPDRSFEELANAVERLAAEEPALFQKIHLDDGGAHIIVGATAHARDIAAQRE